MRLPPRLGSSILSGCLLLGSLALAPSARAEEAPPAEGLFFETYDRNSDGRVSAEEFGGPAEIFRLLDKDGDGAVTPTELGLPADFKPAPRAPGAPRAGDRAGDRARGKVNKDGESARGDRQKEMLQRLRQMDANQDGCVSREEWVGAPALFDRLDRNADGVLDEKDQGKPGAAGPGAPAAGPGEPMGDGPPAHDEQALERLRQEAQRIFQQLDKDADGQIRADEAPSPELLAAADGDGDGGVSLAEFSEALRKRARAGATPAGPRPERAGPRGINPEMLRRFDRDGDGRVMPEEYPGDEAAFARLDRDGDGALTEKDVAPDKPARKEPQTPAAPPAPPAPPGADRAALLRSLDKNADGRVDRSEFLGSSEEWRLLDRNGDGWLTLDE